MFPERAALAVSAAVIKWDQCELLKSRGFSCLPHQHGHYSSSRLLFRCQIQLTAQLFWSWEDGWHLPTLTSAWALTFSLFWAFCIFLRTRSRTEAGVPAGACVRDEGAGCNRAAVLRGYGLPCSTRPLDVGRQVGRRKVWTCYCPTSVLFQCCSCCGHTGSTNPQEFWAISSTYSPCSSSSPGLLEIKQQCSKRCPTKESEKCFQSLQRVTCHGWWQWLDPP